MDGRALGAAVVMMMGWQSFGRINGGDGMAELREQQW